MSLEARELSFSYPGARALYRGFSLAVAPGERVALTGASGVGKTTLCRLLAGYLQPTSGQVLVDGVPLAAGGPPRTARPVQLIWQHPEQAFDPRLRLGRSLAEAAPLEDARARGLRERFGIREGWLARLPHELSGGELMRCCLARALAPRPRYLICDEATAMLDAVTQAELWQVMGGIVERERMGLIIVSHSPALVARIADRAVAVSSC